MKQTLAAFLLFFSINAYSILEVDELVNLANEDQSGLIEAVAQVRGNLSDLTNREIFEEYFELLPFFESKTNEYALNLIYPNIVGELGARMVAHGNRWLRIGTDSTETILSYQQYAELSSAQRFLYQSTEQVRRLETEEEFRLASRNLIALSEYTAEAFPDEIYISNGYNEAVSELSVEAIKKTTDVETILFWQEGLKTQTSMLDYLTYVNNQILSQSSEVESPIWLQTLLSLGTNNLKGNDNFSESTKTFYNDVLIETFMAALGDNSEYASEKSLEFFSLLSYSKLGSFVERWTNPVEEIPSEDFEDHYNISVNAYNYLRNEGLGRNAALISRYISSRMSAEISVLKGYEGTYEFFDERGRRWLFTFLKDSYNRTIAAIADEDRVVLINYYYVQYDFENNSYVGSEYEPDDSPYSSNTIAFSFNENGDAVISMPYVGLNRSARKIQSYPNIFQERNVDAVPILGRYTGELRLPSGTRKEVELNIVQFSETIMARMSSADGHLQVDFKMATDGRDGILYMTGSGSSNGSWTHLRFIHDEENDQLRGFVIIGGWGISNSETVLAKIYE